MGAGNSRLRNTPIKRNKKRRQRFNKRNGHDERTEPQVDKNVIRALFDEIDKDKSGYLDIAELGSFIQKSTGKTPSVKELSYMINEADQDKDGKVSFDEMLLICESFQVQDVADLAKCSVKLVGDFEETTFLVIPSTGNVGHLVASALGKVPTFSVKCGIRETSNEGIIKLVKELEGCETLEVDNNSIPSLTAAMAGVDKVLAYMPSITVSSWGDHIANIMTAAKSTKVRCVYWITGDNTCLSQDGPMVITQNAALARAQDIDVPLVLIKPNNLASNLYAHRETIMKQSAMYIGYKSYVKTVITDPVDVAQFTCTVMSQPVETHAGKTYCVTGPTSISFDEIAGKLVERIQTEEVKGRRRVSNQDSLITIFNEADTDSNGSLSLAELTSLLETIDIPADKAAIIFTGADTDGDQQLSRDEFVNSIGKFYDRKNNEAPETIRLHRLSENDFRGFCAGMGVSLADIDCLVSLYADFDSGQVGGADAVKTEDFERIVGRKPNTFDDWLATNVGTFMASHWDIVKSHARKDLLAKSAFQ